MAGAPRATHIPVGMSSVGARDDHSIFDEHVDDDVSIQFSLRPEQHLPQTSHEGGGTRVKMELDNADPSMFEGFAAYSAPFGRSNCGNGTSIFYQQQRRNRSHSRRRHNSHSHRGRRRLARTPISKQLEISRRLAAKTWSTRVIACSKYQIMRVRLIRY